MTRHPYYITARDEQRDAFRAEVARMIANPAPSTRPVGKRVLPILAYAVRNGQAITLKVKP